MCIQRLSSDDTSRLGVNYFSNTLSGKEISSDLLYHFHIITRKGDDVTLRSKRWKVKFLNISLGIYITPVNLFFGSLKNKHFLHNRLSLLFTLAILLSADFFSLKLTFSNNCFRNIVRVSIIKQFGSRSGQVFCWAQSGSKLFGKSYQQKTHVSKQFTRVNIYCLIMLRNDNYGLTHVSMTRKYYSRPNHGTMRKRHRTLTVTRHQEKVK